MDYLTGNVVPIRPIGDAICKSFIHAIGAVRLASPHHRVIVGIHQRQVAKQTVVLRTAVVALLLVGD